MFKKLGKKTKALGVIVASTVVTASAQADVTYDSATRTLGGNLDMTPYESAIPIVLSVISLTIAVALMIGMFRQAKRG